MDSDTRAPCLRRAEAARVAAEICNLSLYMSSNPLQGARRPEAPRQAARIFQRRYAALLFRLGAAAERAVCSFLDGADHVVLLVHSLGGVLLDRAAVTGAAQDLTYLERHGIQRLVDRGRDHVAGSIGSLRFDPSARAQELDGAIFTRPVVLATQSRRYVLLFERQPGAEVEASIRELLAAQQAAAAPSALSAPGPRASSVSLLLSAPQDGRTGADDGGRARQAAQLPPAASPAEEGLRPLYASLGRVSCVLLVKDAFAQGGLTLQRAGRALSVRYQLDGGAAGTFEFLKISTHFGSENPRVVKSFQEYTLWNAGVSKQLTCLCFRGEKDNLVAFVAMGVLQAIVGATANELEMRKRERRQRRAESPGRDPATEASEAQASAVSEQGADASERPAPGEKFYLAHGDLKAVALYGNQECRVCDGLDPGAMQPAEFRPGEARDAEGRGVVPVDLRQAGRVFAQKMLFVRGAALHALLLARDYDAMAAQLAGPDSAEAPPLRNGKAVTAEQFGEKAARGEYWCASVADGGFRGADFAYRPVKAAHRGLRVAASATAWVVFVARGRQTLALLKARDRERLLRLEARDCGGDEGEVLACRLREAACVEARAEE